MKKFIVDNCYPCIYSYDVTAETPEEAIEAVRNYNMNPGKYTDNNIQERTGNGDIDFSNPPEELVYASEKDYYVRPVLRVTPDKKHLENALKTIIETIQHQFDTADQLRILCDDYKVDKELLKYFGYTEEDFETAEYME